MFSVYEILDIAVKLEKNGEKFCLKAREQVNDPVLIDLLEWMAGEERNHAAWLAGLKSEVAQGQDHHLMVEMSQALVSDYVGKQAFSLDDADFSKIENTADLLRIFIDFEKDTIIFFETLKSFVSDEKTTQKLNQIISEEKVHIKRLQELLGGVSETDI